MAVNGLQPFIKVTDSNGNPIVGAKLHVYEVGTTTYRAIYSDSSLSVSLSNPLTGSNASNASGDFPRFYMASGTYKLRAETSAGVLIWEYDNIDTGTSAGAGALPIASGGTSATTAAAARAALDVPSNSELADLASDIASLSSSIQNIVSQPQGRLTLTTDTPVISSSVSAATAVYYTAFNGNIVPVYDATQFVSRTFSSDLTLTLNSNHTANSIYDVFAFWDGSALQIGTGVVWNTVTAGSGARGTGAGTTELSNVNGLLVNKYDISYRNGATTGTIPANQGTYLGSIYMDGTNGQISCHVAYGQSRKWGVWNAYNRRRIVLKAGDATATWAYSTATYRAANGSSSNSLTIFSGLAEEFYNLSAFASASLAASGTTPGIAVGIGYNSTTAASGFTGLSGFAHASATVNGSATAIYHAPPAIGINVITALEKGTGSSTSTFNGTEAGQLLVATWEG